MKYEISYLQYNYMPYTDIVYTALKICMYNFSTQYWKMIKNQLSKMKSPKC